MAVGLLLASLGYLFWLKGAVIVCIVYVLLFLGSVIAVFWVL